MIDHYRCKSFPVAVATQSHYEAKGYPVEGIYRLGDWGYVTETEYNKAFEHEDGWAQDAYILDGNGVSHTRISQLINEDDTGKAISDYINERFNNDQMDDVFYTEATEEGEC